MLKKIPIWVSLFSICLAAHSAEKSPSLVESCNTQGVSLFYILPRPSNPLISPFSIYTSLLMAYAGSKGDTAKQFAKALDINFDQHQAATSFSKLCSALPINSKENGVELISSNGIWIDKTFPVRPSFQKTIKKDFNGKIKKIQFSRVNHALKTINTSIKEETNDYISNFLSSSNLSSNTKMLLTNILLLKGSWENPFPTEKTGKQEFLNANNDSVYTQMMDQTAMLPYYENKTTQVVALPIEGSQKDAAFSFVIFLPKAHQSNPFDFYYQENDSALNFLKYLDSLESKKVHLTVPKFTVNQKIDISNVLSDLGVIDAFTSQADFSNISEEKNLSLGQALTQSALSINEAGVLSASSSSASLDITSSLDPIDPIRCNVNHPFLFALVDMQSKLIFFIGEYLVPSIQKK